MIFLYEYCDQPELWAPEDNSLSEKLSGGGDVVGIGWRERSSNAS